MNNDSWLYYFELDKASITERYITSLYFSVITMNTVGYGGD